MMLSSVALSVSRWCALLVALFTHVSLLLAEAQPGIVPDKTAASSSSASYSGSAGATAAESFASTVAAGSNLATSSAERGRPNVLFIISDDQGFSDFSFMGNPLVRTPVLDRLAARSARFDNVVVAAACSPSRAAFYTGRDHLLTGVWGVPPRANLRSDEALMPAFFRAAGYRTFYAGKADTARLPDSSPWERGWDDGYFVSGYQHKDPTLPHRGGVLQAKGWTADLMVDLLLDFIRTPSDKPWFATAAFIIPHLPWVCDEAYVAPFLAAGLSEDLARCYGCIAQMDTAIGRLLEGIRALGREADTLVVFVSDNGMTNKAAPDRDLSAADWEKRNRHGLRGHKALVWENGIRVPLLVSWPGRIEPGQRPQLCGAEDLLPTMLDLAGVPASGVRHLPFSGVSLRPSLERPGYVFERPPFLRLAISGIGSPRERVAEGVGRRFEDHHLILHGARFKYHALPGGKGELYDLQADPRETTDVLSRHPDVAASMARECRRRWEEVLASGRAFAPPSPEVGQAMQRKKAGSNSKRKKTSSIAP